MDDLARWLGECLDADRQLAEDAMALSATDGRWEYVETRGGEHKVVDSLGYTITGHYDVDAQPWACEPHMARWSPSRVLREIDAKRKLIADLLAEGHLSSEGDTWYACAALTDEDGDPVCPDESRAPGPCDCGRDDRVGRRLRLLALPYADREGFREEWRP